MSLSFELCSKRYVTLPTKIFGLRLGIWTLKSKTLSFDVLPILHLHAGCSDRKLKPSLHFDITRCHHYPQMPHVPHIDPAMSKISCHELITSRSTQNIYTKKLQVMLRVQNPLTM